MLRHASINGRIGPALNPLPPLHHTNNSRQTEPFWQNNTHRGIETPLYRVFLYELKSNPLQYP